LTTSFSNEYFIIRLFLCSEATFFSQKQQEDLAPLLVIVIMSINLISDNCEIGLESYNSMVDLWKRKQQRYNDIYIEKKDQESILESLIKEKNELELNWRNSLESYDTLVRDYNNYDEEFKNIVINSEKIILLPSYRDYYKLLSKKEVVENNIDEAKSKFRTLKSILSPGVWKDQANKIINESNILELEKSLIQEAKEKPYFKKEYKVFGDLKEKIEDTNELINKEKENIKNNDSLIDNINTKINELQRQLNKIKELYLDIEEGYY